MTGHGSGDHRRAGVSVRPRREAAGIVPLPPTSERRDMQARASQASRAPGLTPRPTAGPCQNRQFCAPHRQRSRHRTPAHTRQGDCYHTAGLAVTPRNSLRLETGRPGARSTSPAATSARAAAHRHIKRRWPGPSQRAQVFGEDCAGQGAGAVLGPVPAAGQGVLSSGSRPREGWMRARWPGTWCRRAACPRSRRGIYRAAVTATMKSMIAWRAAGLSSRIGRS